MITKKFFNSIVVNISDDDWDFLCKKRFFTNNPTDEDVCAEFVTGTGITPNKPQLWNEADQRFSEYIKDLRKICSLDINRMCREKMTLYDLEKR